MKVDTLITGATVITVDTERRVIRDGAVAITGDTIVAVGKRAEIEAQVEATEIIDGSRFVLTPGFINNHVHVTETLIRGFLPENLPFDENIGRWVIPLYEAHTVQEQIIATKLAIAAMLRSGTTSFLEAGTIKAFDEVMEAIDDSGIRGRTGRWTMDRAFDPNADQIALTETAVAALAADIACYPEDGRAIAAWPNLIGHNTASDALWQQAKLLADTTGTGISAHMSPVVDDSEWYLANTGKRPIVHLNALGVLGPNLNLVHMVYVDSEEIALLAATNTNVTHCPGASLRTGLGTSQHGLFPEMAEAGINLSLGTDGCDNHDMMRVMTLMAGLFKDARNDRGVFPAESVLEMATINGAKALGMADSIGSIEVGKKADIVAHDTFCPEWQPTLDPVRQLVWSADGRSVHSVWVDGRRVVDNFRCTTMDEGALYIEGQVAANAVVARSGLPFRPAWALS
jgi:cytosine/adenosine deaminase-related metal-dependent hydrolase